MLPKYGTWTVVSELGAGSYGSVYLIEREDFGHVEQAALKVISIPKRKSEINHLRNNGMSDDEISEYYKSLASDIVKEYELMTKLKGTTNVVSYEDHFVCRHEDNIGWDIMIRMELLQPLNSFITMKNRHISKRDVIKMGIDICEALERCQKFNIIHRDIKPDNIFVSNQGDYKLGDFGVARTFEGTLDGLTKTGTPSYMAPEVYKGKEYGYSVDIYSLGMVMYKLLNNNTLPFLPVKTKVANHKEREQALIRRMSGEPLPLPCMDNNRLAEIVLKACSYLPENRYSSPTTMKQDLEAILYSRTEQKWILEYVDQLPTLPSDSNQSNQLSLDDETKTIGKIKKSGAGKLKNVIPFDLKWIFGAGLLGTCVVIVACITIPKLVHYKADSDASISADTTFTSTEAGTQNETIVESLKETSDSASDYASYPCVIKEQGDAGYTLEKEYDEDGRLVQEIQYHADGTKGFTIVYKYDERGNEISKTHYREDQSIWKSTEQEYDDQNRCIVLKEYQGNDLITRSEYEWKDDKKERIRVYDSSETLVEVHEFNYAEDGTYQEVAEAKVEGRFPSSQNIDGEEVAIWKTTFDYDVSDQVTKQSNYDQKGMLISYCELKYDYKFRQTQQSWYFGNGIVEGHVEYTYDEDGSTTEQTLYDANGKILCFIQNEIGADGKLTITSYDSDRSIVTQEVFDEEGNSLSADDYGEFNSYKSNN